MPKPDKWHRLPCPCCGSVILIERAKGDDKLEELGPGPTGPDILVICRSKQCHGLKLSLIFQSPVFDCNANQERKGPILILRENFDAMRFRLKDYVQRKQFCPPPEPERELPWIHPAAIQVTNPPSQPELAGPMVNLPHGVKRDR